MEIIDDIKMYGRFLWGLRSYFRQPISLKEARIIVQNRLAQRENNFLRLVERGIFGYSHSPYLPLLKNVGCEMADIRKMVKAKGLEKTLSSLREAGVYITFEQFKGREPIVCDGKEIPVKVRDFDNPYLKHYYQAESGGTTGAGTRVSTDLDHLAAQAPNIMLTREAHGVLNVPTAIWHGILPDNTGVSILLRQARFGRIADKWFSPISSRDIRFSLKNRLANYCIVSAGRLFGVPFPRPEHVSLDQAAILTYWAFNNLKIHGKCLIRGSVSKVLRICLVARENNIDLRGVTFMGGSEPPTPAKVKQITLSNAKWVPTYFFTEAGAVGLGCANPVDGNDLHFQKDALAVIQHPIQVPGSEITVDAFHWTSLLATTPKIMLNVESDDYGVIEKRSCGCPLEHLGFTEHLREIRSYRKLTGEGTTLVGSEMIHILEEILPARFGGSPLDYQLMEEEDNVGLTRISLIVSPKIKINNEKEVIETVLEALGQGSDSADLTRALWQQTGSLQVKRMEPVWTSRGKMMPLHVTRRSNARANT